MVDEITDAWSEEAREAARAAKAAKTAKTAHEVKGHLSRIKQLQKSVNQFKEASVHPPGYRKAMATVREARATVENRLASMRFTRMAKSMGRGPLTGRKMDAAAAWRSAKLLGRE